jgi:hypothetical protein
VRRALDLIGETLLPLNAMAEMDSTTARAAYKWRRLSSRSRPMLPGFLT